MTVDEALEVLGTPGLQDLTPEALRRAYLRKLRDHSPERDPQGFARLRSSYELLRSFVVAVERLREPAIAAEPEIAIEPPPVSLACAPMIALPQLDDVIREGCARLARGDVAGARGVVEEGRAIADEVGVPATDTLTRWVQVRELLDVAEFLARPVREALSRAIPTGDFAAAREELRGFRRANRFAADEADAMLEHRARSLHAAVAASLGGRPPVWARVVRRYRAFDVRFRAWNRRARRSWWYWTAVIAIVAVIAILAPPDHRHDARESLGAIEDLSTWVLADGGPRRVDAAQMVRDAARSRDCVGLRRGALTLGASVDSSTPDDMRDVIGRIRDRVATICPDDRTKLP
jgi:hypothetical protein